MDLTPRATACAAAARTRRHGEHAAVIRAATDRGGWRGAYESYLYQTFGALLPLLDHERRADFMNPDDPMGLWPGIKQDAADTLPAIAELLHVAAQLGRPEVP
jgi:hypothetical protein